MGRVGLPGQQPGSCPHAVLVQNKESLQDLDPQSPHLQRRLNTISEFSANMGLVGTEDITRIVSSHREHSAY